MKEQDEIDNLFKSTFEDFAVAPPASVKTSVDRSISRMKWKKTIQFSSFFAAIVILVVASILFFSSDDQTVRTTSSNQPLTDNEISNYSSPGKNEENNDASENKSGENIADSADFSGQAVARESNEENQASQAEKSIQKAKENSTLKGSSISVSEKKQPEKENTGKQNRLHVISAKKEKTEQMTSGNPSSKKNKNTGKAGNILTAKTEASGTNDHPVKTKEKELVSGNKVKDNSSNRATEKSATSNTESKSPADGSPGKGNAENVISSNASKETKPLETSANKTSGNPAAVKDTTKTLTETKDSTGVSEPVSPIAAEKKLALPLLLSFHGGTTFGFNSAKSSAFDTKISEKSAFFIQCEAAYYFTPKLAAGTGLGYQSWKENVSKDIHTPADSVIISYTVEYIIDTVAQSIDSILIPNYQATPGVDVSLANNYNVYAFTVPLYFNYTHPFSPKLFLDLGVGAILSFQGNRSITETFGQGANTVHSFGMRAYVRPQLRYQFSAWGVSLITNFGYDMIPVNSLQDIKRSRTYLNVGLGLHYRLGK